MNIFSFLQKPYPLPESTPAKLRSATAVSVIVFLFLFIVKPFGSGGTLLEQLLSAALAGAIVFVVVIFHFFFTFSLFPHYFSETHWTVGRELIWNLLIIISIAFANIGVSLLLGDFPLTWKNVFLMITYTALVGMAPATASVIINQRRLLIRYKKQAAALSLQIPAHPEARDENKQAAIIPPAVTFPENEEELIIPSLQPGRLTFIAENGKDEVTVEIAQLLAITSADNYSKLYIREGHSVKVQMLRSSLKKIEEQLTGFPDFWRCHRTAIVHFPQVEQVSGTAQGYRLHLEGLTETIPVSRSLNVILRQKLANPAMTIPA